MLFFTPLLSFYTLFLVISQTDGTSTEADTQGKLLSPMEEMQKFLRSSHLPRTLESRAWSAVKRTCLCSHSSPLEPTLWVANLTWHVYNCRLTWILQALPGSEVQHSSCSTTQLSATYQLRSQFQCMVFSQYLNMNNESCVEWTARYGHFRFCQRHCNGIARFNSQKPPH